MNAKTTKAKQKKKSSGVSFERLKFLDWQPPTEAEKALEVRARKEAKEAELKRVTDLAKKREAARRR